MATVYPNRSRTDAASQLKRQANQPAVPSRTTNNSKQTSKRLTNRSTTSNLMSKPSSILKRRPFELEDAPMFINQKQPSDIEPITSRRHYTPIHTPSRLRTLTTTYRTNLTFPRITSPLPMINDSLTPAVNLDAWGVTPTDLNLLRRYPSPLSQFGLSSGIYSRKKAPSDYVFFRTNEAFANEYVEDFIGRCIEDQLLPDLLLEIIGELDRESKKHGGKADRYYKELNQRKKRTDSADTRLLSDDWIHEVDYQPTPRVRFHELPSDVQGRLLADLNQEIIDYEIEYLLNELSGQTLTTRVRSVPPVHHTRFETYSDPVREISYESKPIDQTQRRFLENQFYDAVSLNQLISRYLRQANSAIDFDDQTRLLDSTILENLVSRYQSIARTSHD